MRTGSVALAAMAVALLALLPVVAFPLASWADECPAGGAHEYEAMLVEQASEDAEGLRVFTCAKCGQAYEEAIPATGHEWGPWTEELDAQGQPTGREVSVCLRDSGHLRVREVVVEPAPEAAPDEASAAPDPAAASEPAPEPVPASAPALETAGEPASEPWPNALDLVLLAGDALACLVFAAKAYPLAVKRAWIERRRAEARSAVAGKERFGVMDPGCMAQGAQGPEKGGRR